MRVAAALGLLTGLALLALPASADAVDGARARQMFARSGTVRYNRVEGLFLGYRLGFSPGRAPGLSLHVQTGFGFDNRRVRWETGLAYEADRATLGLKVFDRTDSKDPQTVGTGENTVFTVLFKWDYLDYFRARNGFELKGSYRVHRHVRLIGSLSGFAYERMPVETQWSLFYPDRPFRANPAVREGDVGLLALGAAYDSRRGGPLFRNAWRASAVFRRAFREFDHNGFDLAVSRYQKTIFGNQAVVVTARMASAQSTAEQFRFDLGGVGTLRGYEIREYSGNRVLLFSADYLFRGDILHRVPVRGFNLLNLVLFADAGWLATQPADAGLLDGFGGLALSDFKPDVGLSLALPRQIFRLNIARRLDRRGDAWVLSARIRYAL